MKWKIKSLDDSLRSALSDAYAARGLEGELSYFQPKLRGMALCVCAAIGLAASGAGLLFSFTLWQDGASLPTRIIGFGLTGVAVLWTLLVLVEAVRALGSRTRPFVLITPRAIVEGGWDHAFLTGYRLRDATNFKAVDTYSGKDFRGRSYHFTFPDGGWELKVRDARGIERLEQVLAQARAGAATAENKGADLLPEAPGLDRASGRRPFTDPFGEVWLCVAGLLVLGLLVGLVAGDIYSRYRGRS